MQGDYFKPLEVTLSFFIQTPKIWVVLQCLQIYSILLDIHLKYARLRHDKLNIVRWENRWFLGIRSSRRAISRVIVALQISRNRNLVA